MDGAELIFIYLKQGGGYGKKTQSEGGIK